MHDSQIDIPESFVALYVRPGRPRPQDLAVRIAARHDLCEDVAMSLAPQAMQVLHKLNITEADVIDKMLEGLLVPAVEGEDEAPLVRNEAKWVVCRMAELLNWTHYLTPELAAIAVVRH